MRGLTILQPWAQAIAAGQKWVETRPKRTTFRGQVAIHAGKALPPFEVQVQLRHVLQELSLPWDLTEYPRGCVVAVAVIGGCAPADELAKLIRARIDKGTHARYELQLGDYRAGRFGWTIDTIVPLAIPYPLRGQQGLFPISARDQYEIRRRLLTPIEVARAKPAPAPPKQELPAELEEVKRGVVGCPDCGYTEPGDEAGKLCPKCSDDDQGPADG